MMAILAALIVAHCVCDYPLQGDFLARAKNHMNPIAGVPFYQALLAHAIIHAGGVWLVTGSAALGLAELVAHTLIDWAKCNAPTYHAGWQRYYYNVDQLAHVLCKVLWVALLVVMR